MAGEAYSGKSGTVYKGTADTGTAATELFEVTKWTLDMTAAVHKYNSNATAGHKRAVAGVRDTKGTIAIKVNDDGPALYAGQAVSLRLRDSANTADYFHIQHAVIAGNPVECDIDDGQIVGMTYSFEASDVDGAGRWAAATP